MNLDDTHLAVEFLKKLNDLPFYQKNKSDLTWHLQQRSYFNGINLTAKFKGEHCMCCSVKFTPENSKSNWKISKKKRRWEFITCLTCGAINLRGGLLTVPKTDPHKSAKATKKVTKAAVKKSTEKKAGLSLDSLLSGL